MRGFTEYVEYDGLGLAELIRSKQKGVPVKAQPVQRQTNVINLMDALRRSVEGAGAPSSAKGGAEPASDRKTEKTAPARKAGKTSKSAPKARAAPAKTRTRKAG